MFQSTSIVPGVDYDTYLVQARFGRSWCETDVENTNLKSIVARMLDGHFSNPVRVIGFNTAQGWSRDVSAEVAHQLQRRCRDQGRDLPNFVVQFVERHKGRAASVDSSAAAYRALHHERG
jgi:hypothetical protein